MKKIFNIFLLISTMLTCDCSNEKQNTSDIEEDGSTLNQQEEMKFTPQSFYVFQL